MTTQAGLLASDVVADRCPILQEAAALIADPQVRYLGTVGGNVANGDPANDMPAIMQCLDAAYLLSGGGGARIVKARDFYEGAFFTKLQERSEEHTSELQSLMRISYAVFCLEKKNTNNNT